MCVEQQQVDSMETKEMTLFKQRWPSNLTSMEFSQHCIREEFWAWMAWRTYFCRYLKGDLCNNTKTWAQQPGGGIPILHWKVYRVIWNLVQLSLLQADALRRSISSSISTGISHTSAQAESCLPILPPPKREVCWSPALTTCILMAG